MGIRVSPRVLRHFRAQCGGGGIRRKLVAPVVGIQAEMGDVILKDVRRSHPWRLRRSIGGAVVGGFLLASCRRRRCYFGATFKRPPPLPCC